MEKGFRRMTTRRNLPEDWRPQQATRISTKPQPRTESLRIPQSAGGYGDISNTNRRPPYDASAMPAAPPPSRNQSAEYQDSLQKPEIVEISSGQSWHRRPQNVPSRKCLHTPSVYSQASARQSEISLGILDYYMGSSSIDNPDPLPAAPVLETQFIDPAIEQLDFGLAPPLQLDNPSRGLVFPQTETSQPIAQSTPSKRTSQSHEVYPCIPEDSLPVQSTPANSASRPKPSYALFPNVEATTPVRSIVKVSQTPTVPPPAVSSPTTPVTPTYPSAYRDCPSLPRASLSESSTEPTRPRNASLSNSVRSRKDSFTSFHYPNKRIPLRLLSSSTTTSSASSGNKASPTSLPEEPLTEQSNSSPVNATTYSRRRDVSLPNASMPRSSDNYEASPYHTPISSSNKYSNFSRWSDETCPSATSTPPSQREPRTSFTSLLKKEDEGYPACFFESSDDEDEASPLRQKLKWKTRKRERKQQQQQSHSQRHNAGTRTKQSFWNIVCCCSNEVDD